MSFLKALKIGAFLSYRQIKKTNFWVNALIIFIMVVTFLNLVFISGILEGLVTGASRDFKNHYSGDIIITPEDGKINIINTNRLISEIEDISEISSYSVRYLSGGRIEADNSFINIPNLERNSVNAVITGIDFGKENNVTGLASFIVDGSYIYDRPQNRIIIGSGFLDEYDSAIEGSTLEGVGVGDKVKITISGEPREYVVGGIVKSKINQINNRIFIDTQQFVALTGRSVQRSDEVAITITNNQDLEKIINSIKGVAISSQARVESWQENQGQFFDDLSNTFRILGAVIGAIGLAVASVTLFIVIFINAISREKYIGILKGIGIESSVIKYSYVFQSIFYAFVGSLIGVFILYAFLVPYFSKNPIDFPFSDGILDITPEGVLIRVFILFVSSVIAGIIPSHFILKKYTIDSILGRWKKKTQLLLVGK